MFNKEDVILFAKNEASCYKEKIILFCDYNRPEERYNIFLNYYCPDLSRLFDIDASFIFENFIINKSVDIKNINYYVIKDFCVNLIEIYNHNLAKKELRKN